MIYSNFITPASHAISNLFCGIANFRKSSYLHNIKHPHDFMFKITQPNSISAQREKKNNQQTYLFRSIQWNVTEYSIGSFEWVRWVQCFSWIDLIEYKMNKKERWKLQTEWETMKYTAQMQHTVDWLVIHIVSILRVSYLLLFFLHIMWVSVGLFSRLHEQCRRSDVLQLAHTRARSGHSRWMWVWVLFLPYIGVSIHGARHTALYAIFILFQIGVFISLKQMNDF